MKEIGGRGNVEIDEILIITRRKYNRGSEVSQQCFFFFLVEFKQKHSYFTILLSLSKTEPKKKKNFRSDTKLQIHLGTTIK